MAIRVVSAGTTIVKSVTVGTPTRTGLPSAGLLTNLDDVVSTGVSDGEFLQYDSSTSKFIFASTAASSRSAISVQDNGGAGELSYDSSTGVISYSGETDAQTRAKFSASTGVSYNSSTGEFTIDNSTSSLAFDSNTATLTYTDVGNNSVSTVLGLAKFTTDDLTEGSTNQYYTNAKVQSQIDSNFANVPSSLVPDSNEVYDLGSSQFKWRDLYLSGNTIVLGSLTLTDSSGTLVVRDSDLVVTPTDLSANNTDQLTEGSTNLYLNGAGTTSDLTEGGNLYYTDARARSAFSLTEFGSGKFSYDSANGILTVRDSDLARTDIKETFQEGIIIPDDKKITFCSGVVDIFENGGDFFIRRNDVGESSSDIYIMTRHGATIFFEDETGNDKIATFRDHTGIDFYFNNVLNWQLDSFGVHNYRDQTIDGKLTVGDSATINGNITVDGNTLITGNLTVEGTTTTINSTTLSINDKNIVLADSAADSTAANGAGLTINGANATITYTALTDTWDLNKPLGTDVNAISNYTSTNLTEGSNLYYTTVRADSDFDVRLATKTTDDVTEGSNLYYTTVRFDSDFGDNTTSDLTEGTNLYYTQTRFDSALGDKTTDNLTEGSNLYYTDARFDARLSVKTTSDLDEGTNLYYTTARADSAFDVKLASKSTTDLAEGTNLYYTIARDSAQFITNFAQRTTGDLTEGSNLYYTQTRVDSAFDARLATKSTDHLTEGANLYYTLARDDSAFDVKLASDGVTSIIRGYFSSGGDVTYDSSTGKISVDVDQIYTQAEFDSDLGQSSTTNLPEGTNLYYTTVRHDSDFTQSFALQTTGDLTEGSNLYYTTVRADSDFDVRLATKSTTNLAEGTNLYYTTARADSDARHAIDILNVSGDGSLTYNSATGVINYDGPSPAETRAHFSAGGDISYDSTTGKFNLDVELEYTADNFDSDLRDRLTTTTTDSIGEGSLNLYYTSARSDSDAKNAISITDAGGDGSLAYNSGTGVITYTGPSASEVRSHFSAGVGIDINNGTIRTDSAADVTFSTITNTSGDINTNPSEVLITTSTVTAIDTILHGGINQSVEYLIHLYDSTGDDTQITKMLATFNGSSIASNEFGTVFTGSTDLGNLDITVDGTNINLTFERYDTGSIDNVRAKVSKTIIK